MTPEFLKALSGVFLQNLNAETPVTSKILSAVPNEHHDYKPDPKSKTAIELAWHIASVDVWFIDCIVGHSFQLPQREMPADVKTGKDIAAWFDKEIAAGVPKLADMSGDQLATTIDFYGMFNMPAAMYLQFMNNHSIHHRGQLSTYLRAMGGKCPSIYGGSADEPMAG